MTNETNCCSCGCNALARLEPIPDISVNVRTSGLDIVGLGVNSVIAAVAVLSFIVPRFLEWFYYKYKLIIPEEKKYSYKEEECSRDDTGKESTEKNVIYSLPVKNNGNVKLCKCEAQTDCVFKKAADGISFEKAYKGLPRRFQDIAMGETFDLPVDGVAYIQLIKFVPDKIEQSGMTGGENLKENGEEKQIEKTAMRGGGMKKKQIAYSWGLQAKSRNAVGSALSLKSEPNVDYYVHLICKAENMKNVYKTWLVIHWSGSLVDDSNLTIRLASKEELNQADAELEKLAKGV